VKGRVPFRKLPGPSPCPIKAGSPGSGCPRATLGNGKHYYLLQTELRIEKLAAPNCKYDHDAAGWNEFIPELEALYGRIELLKP